MYFIISWLVSTLAIIIAAYLIPAVTIDSFFAALVTALVLGLINALLRPLILVLTLPLNILTLGLLTFVINALLIMLTDIIVPGFSVANFWWALLFGILLSVINIAFNQMKREVVIQSRETFNK